MPAPRVKIQVIACLAMLVTVASGRSAPARLTSASPKSAQSRPADAPRESGTTIHATGPSQGIPNQSGLLRCELE
jgi:hypothetical protein